MINIITDEKYRKIAGKIEFTEEEYINIRKRHPEIEMEYAKEVNRLKAEELTKAMNEQLANAHANAQKQRENLLAEQKEIEGDLAKLNNLTFVQYQIHMIRKEKEKRLFEISSQLSEVQPSKIRPQNLLEKL